MKKLSSQQSYFELLHLSGEGLNSYVYKAYRKDFKGVISQTVALKILKSRECVSFWRQEVQSLLQVNSPYCVKVLGFEWIQERPAMVLEWLEGITLAELYNSAAISNEACLEILTQIQEGLIDLHLAGLCHGDLHMGNVFVTRDGNIKLLDFGMANAQRIRIQGAPSLRAPELQSIHSSVSLWSDLYSLGLMAKEIGRPFSQLTHSCPEQRDLIPHKPTTTGKAELSLIAQKAQQKRDFIRKQKTSHLLLPQKTATFQGSWMLALFLSSFFLFKDTSAHKSTKSLCSLEVRTKKWHQIQVDSQASLFTPFSVVLESCGTRKLFWKNAKHHGHRQIFINPGSILKLQDKDFK